MCCTSIVRKNVSFYLALRFQNHSVLLGSHKHYALLVTLKDRLAGVVDWSDLNNYSTGPRLIQIRAINQLKSVLQELWWRLV